jgi:murein DD-endopeptidase MepM/ murein hydrolase activator NlpD
VPGRDVSLRLAGVLVVAVLLMPPLATDGCPVHALKEHAAASEANGRGAAPTARRFWARDKHFYRSPWYAGRHRKMVPFGCTRAPYYPPDPRCADDRGYHHGLDIAMPCRTRLYAGVRGRVVRPDSAGALGPAYGPHAFRLRNLRLSKDFVIGHVRRVYVRPGARVARGQLMALASDAGAPDGCHLHFEVRPVAASYTDAVRPTRYLRLRRTD